MNITDLQNFQYVLSVLDELENTSHQLVIKYQHLFFTADFFVKKANPDYNVASETYLETSDNFTYLSDHLPNFPAKLTTNQIADARHKLFDNLPKDVFGSRHEIPEDLLLIPFISHIISTVDKTLAPQNTLNIVQNFKTLDGTLDLPYYHFPSDAKFEVVTIFKHED